MEVKTVICINNNRAKFKNVQNKTNGIHKRQLTYAIYQVIAQHCSQPASYFV